MIGHLRAAASGGIPGSVQALPVRDGVGQCLGSAWSTRESQAQHGGGEEEEKVGGGIGIDRGGRKGGWI